MINCCMYFINDNSSYKYSKKEDDILVKVSMLRNNGLRRFCSACGCIIEDKQPMYSLTIGIHENPVENTHIRLCEDCGNDLNNDISEEYSKFVDLNK
jgi:hypothetical protein